MNLSVYFSVVIIAILYFPAALAADIYLAPNGNDINTGDSPANAVFTLNRADFLASSNDNVILLEGIYDWPSTQTLTKPLKVSAAAGASPTLTSSTITNTTLILIDAQPDGIVTSLAGLKFDLSTKASLNAIAISSRSDINVSNCTILCNNSALDSCRAFVAQNVRVRLENVTVQGGAGSLFTSLDSGSWVKKSQFRSCATSGDGGAMAITSTANDFIVEDTLFQDNAAFNAGGVLATSSNVVFVRVTCTGNTVLRSGGCVQGIEGSNITVRDCTFTGNQAGDDISVPEPRPSGGAISLHISGTLNVMSSYFFRNGPAVAGGALASYGRAVMNVNSSRFVENLTKFRGGAIFSDAGDLRIYDSWFEANINSASGPAGLTPRGSAVSAHAIADFSRFIETLFYNCTFLNHVAVVPLPTLIYGAAHIGRRSAHVYGCSFLNNSAFALGGLTIAFVDYDAIVDSCLFQGNIGQQGPSLFLGFIPTAGVTVRNCRFVENQAYAMSPLYGVFSAGLYLQDIVNITLVASSFVRNRCDGAGVVNIGRGCAIHLPSSDRSFQIVVSGSSFHQNMYTNANGTSGFVVSVQQGLPNVNGRLLIDSSNFTQNYYRSNAEKFTDDTGSCGVVNAYVPFGLTGAFSLSAEFNDCIFDRNEGRISATFCGQDASVTARNCRFTNNFATSPFSGVAFLAASSLTGPKMNVLLDSNYWANNTATKNPDTGSTVATDLAANSINPLATLDIAFVNNTFADVLVTDDLLSANVQFVGVTARFLPTPSSAPGELVPFPTMVIGFNNTFDVSLVQLDAEQCTFWHGGIFNTTSRIFIGDYDLNCRRRSQLCDTEVYGLGAGKLVFADGGDFGVCDDYTPRLINITFENRGSIDQWNSTVHMKNSSIVNAVGAFWRLPLWSDAALLRGSSTGAGDSFFFNYGELRASVLMLDNVHILFDNDTSLLSFELTNFWSPSGIHLYNGSTASLGGIVTLFSDPMRLYTEPKYGQSFPVIFSETPGSVRLNWTRIDFVGGYEYSLEHDSSRSNVSARVLAFFPITSQMGDDGQTLSIGFPRPTSAVAKNCSDILSVETIESLDGSPLCTWTDTSSLVIRSTKFPRGLRFLPGTVWDASEQNFRWTYYTYVGYYDPLSPLSPQVVLSGPLKSTSCSDLVMDARTSVIRGDPSVSLFRWIMTGNSDLTSLAATVASITDRVLRLPASLFPLAERNYTFCLNITNSLNLSSSACASVTRVSALLPSVFIEGPAERFPLVVEAVALHARVDVPSCASNFEIQRQWVQTAGPAPTLPPLGTNQFSLFLPAGSLSPTARYVFQFRAWINATAVATQSVLLTPRSSDLIVVSTGASGLVPSNAPVNMSVAVLDPNSGFAAISAASLYTAWEILSCPGRASDSVISASSLASSFLSRNARITIPGQRVVEQDSTNNFTILTNVVLCRDSSRSIKLSDSVGSSYLINGTDLPLGEYLFGVTAFANDNRTSRAVVSVLTGSASSYSRIQFQTNQFDVGKVLSQERLALTALLDGGVSPPTTGSLQWSDALQSPGVITISNLATSASSDVLVFKPDVLSPGQIYSIQAQLISGANTVLGSNKVFLLPNRGPTSGRLRLSNPTAGRFDRIEIIADSWVDEDVPLNYLFSIRVPAFSREIFLGDATDASSLSFLVPVQGPATLILRVADSNGARTEYQNDVTFGSSSTTAAPTVDDYERRISWGDIRSASQIATAIILSSQGSLPSSQIDRFITPLLSIAQGGQLSPISLQAILSTLSVSCSNSTKLSGSAATAATQILLRIVQLAENQAQRAFSGSTSKLSNVIASYFLATAANVAQSVATNQQIAESTRAEVLDVISRIVALQAREATANEQAQSLLGQFLNATSQILSSTQQPISTSVGTVMITLSSTTTTTIPVQTITWTASTFPYAPANGGSFQSNVITVLMGTSSSGSVTVDFDAAISSVSQDTKCGRLDEQTKVWTSTGCSLTPKSAGSYSCTCQLPASSGTSQRISLSLLIGAVELPPPISSGAPGSAGVGGAGLSAGAAAAIAVVIVLVAACLVAAVMWWQKREVVIAARNKMVTLFSRNRTQSSAAAAPAADASRDSTLTSSSSRWRLASKPSVTSNVA